MLNVFKWKEKQVKHLQPTLTFSDHLFAKVFIIYSDRS